MKKTLIFLIVNFFLINNVLAENNYLKCIETIDKKREHFLNEGDINMMSFIQYDDKKNKIKIHYIYRGGDGEKPDILSDGKFKITELGFLFEYSETNQDYVLKDLYDFIKTEDQILYTRKAYLKAKKIFLDFDSIGKCKKIEKKDYRSLLKNKSWNF